MHADPYSGRCYFRSILSIEEGRRTARAVKLRNRALFLAAALLLFLDFSLAHDWRTARITYRGSVFDKQVFFLRFLDLSYSHCLLLSK